MADATTEVSECLAVTCRIFGICLASEDSFLTKYLAQIMTGYLLLDFLSSVGKQQSADTDGVVVELRKFDQSDAPSITMKDTVLCSTFDNSRSHVFFTIKYDF